MITVNITREEDKKRYVYEFDNRILKWYMFLPDSVYNDPRQFQAWQRSMLQDIQLKISEV